MTDALDTAIDALGRVPSPLRWDHVTSRPAATSVGPSAAPSSPRRSRRPLVAVAAAVVLLVAGAAVVLTTDDDDGDQVHTEPGPSTSPTTSTTTAPTTTAPTSTARTARGQTVVTAVTDEAYLVWGGEDGTSELDRVDGFSVDLEHGTVSEIPNAPISPSDGGAGAWTGTELVVWSTVAPQAAAWDPFAREWRSVATPRNAGTSGEAAVWAGDRIVAVGRDGSASYDPATDVWTEIPSVPGLPTSGRFVDLVWTGEEVVAWVPNAFGGPYTPEGEDVLADRGWSWAPGDAEWAPLPDLPPGSRTSLASITWTGTQVMAWGTSTTRDDSGSDVGVGALWEPGDDDWSPVAPSPQGRGEGFEGTQGSQALAADPTTGRVLVHPLDLGGGIGDRDDYFYDPGTDTWAYGGPLLDGYSPVVSYHDGLILRPDPVSPRLGPL